MKVALEGGEVVELGATESTPTIGITDYSRRVTDDFGVTTVVQRGFSRRMSVRLAVPFDGVDALQRQLADLRATSALWIADDDIASLEVEGFYKDFALDLAVPPVSYCTLTVEGLAETAPFEDLGGDPAPEGQLSTLQLLQPVTLTTAALTASNVAETDYPEWAIGTSYAAGARVIKVATHRVYESATAGNIGHDPASASGHWIDIGPTNRWAMFDEALGTATSKAGSIVVTIAADAANAVALLDVSAATVRVQAAGYDTTKAVGAGPVTFLDLPPVASVTVTIAGAGTVSVGTMLVGSLVALGVTEASPTAGITDYSRKETDDFGEVTIVERAWAKRMTARALIRTDAVDNVFARFAAVRAKPSLWIGQDAIDSLTLYGFFKDFTIEVGETVSTVSLTVEGLSKAAPIADAAAPPFSWAGDWVLDRSYQHNEIVRFNGRTFGSKADGNLNHQPPGAAVDDDYWFFFVENGEGGTPGPAGADGQTSYVHQAWANSADGATGFSTSVSLGKLYTGFYSDFTAADSNDPAAYSWTLIKGADGASAITGLLSNENVTLIADAAGAVSSYAGATGEFKIFAGSADISAFFVLSTQSNPQAVTIGYAARVYTVTAGLGPTVPSASVVIRATGSGPYAGVIVDKIFSLSTSKTGAAGTSPPLIVVTSTHQTFRYNSAGAPLAQSTTISAARQNTAAATEWRLLKANGVEVIGFRNAAAFVLAGAGVSTPNNDTVVIDQAQFEAIIAPTNHNTPGLIYEVRIAGTAQVDRISIVKVADGAQGPAGTSAYSVILSNENHGVPADAAGNVSSYAGAETTVQILFGATDVTSSFALGSFDNPENLSFGGVYPSYSLVGGFDAAENAATATFHFVGGGAHAGVNLQKQWSFTKQKVGAAGAAGTSPPLIVVTSTHQTFRFDKDGVPLVQGTAIRSARQNATGSTAWRLYKADGTLVLDGTAAFIVANGGASSSPDNDTLLISHNQFAAVLAAQGTTGLIYEAAMPGAADRISIVKVQDGVTGPGQFTLVGHANVTIAGNKITKSGGGNPGWDASAYSAEGYAGDVQAACQCVNKTQRFMVGLSSNPTADASYTSITAAAYNDAGVFRAWSGASQIGAGFGAVVDGDFLYVRRRGDTMEFGVVGEAVPRTTVALATLGLTAATKLYFDTVLYDFTMYLPNCSLQPVGKDGTNGVSPILLSLSVVAMDVAADSSNVTKPGALPKGSVVTLKQGTTALVPVSVTFTYSDGGAGAFAADYGVVANTVRVTTANAPGWIDVNVVYAGVTYTQRIAISRSADPQPPPSQTSAYTSVTGGPGTGATTYDGSGILSPELVLKANGAGQIVASFSGEYWTDTPAASVRTLTMAARAEIAPQSTGVFSAPLSEQTGTQANWDKTDASPGMVSCGGTFTGLTAGAYYRVRINSRKVSGSNPSGYINGDFSVTQ